MWTEAIHKGVAGVKTFAMNVAALTTLGAGIFTATLPDLSPIDTAQYQAVKFGDQLLFSVDVAKDSTYGATVVLYSGNDYIGTLPIPQVGQRVTQRLSTYLQRLRQRAPFQSQRIGGLTTGPLQYGLVSYFTELKL